MIVRKRGGKNAVVVEPTGLLASTNSYKLYLGRKLDSGETYLVRIPQNSSDNGLIFAEERLLKGFKKLSDELEKARIAEQGDDGRRIHYDWLFPIFEDGFVSDELDGRRAEVLKILDAKLDEFIPLSKLRNGTRVDAKSAAWVLGRLLKLQAFLDDSENNRSIDFDPDLVLIAPNIHRIVYVGWFDELKRGGDRSQSQAKLLSKANINRMFDLARSWVLFCDLEGEEDFTEWLRDAHDRYSNGLLAHENYYAFLLSLWGSGYHPFTYNRDGVWRNVDMNTPAYD